MPYDYSASRWFVNRQAILTENATSLTHTATFNLPAGSTLLDIIVTPVVLWGATTSATLNIGDANSATGWFAAVALKTQALGTRLQASASSYWAAKNGAYLVSASSVFGRATTTMLGGFCPVASSVIAVVTVVGPVATVGRTVVQVMYARGKSVTPVLA